MRFPEFKGEWKKKHLSELVGDIKDRISTSSLSVDNYVSTENILQNFQGVTLATSLPHNTNVTAFRKDDILFSNIRPYLKKIWYASYDGGCSTDVFVFRNSGMCSAMFLYHLIANDKFINYVMLGTKGTKMPRGDKQQIIQYVVYLPSKLEQNKIATFLSLLDSRIEAQIKIIEDLKLLKKTMSQNIFSLKIRFKDEEGNVFSSWKLRKLSDVLIIQGGYAFKSSLFNQGTNKVIRIGDILPIIKLSNFSGIYSSETPNEKYIVRKNDFVMALSGATFGKVGKIEDKGIAYINQRVATFRTKQCLEFFYQLVQINNFKNYISSIPTASAQPNISNDDIGNYKSYIPDVMEQTKIAGFLSTIDNKIETERAILDAYAKQKQYLLANLLI
ncbi:restriction endonuclease subunit S [Bacteroides acidifaciens]|uniref:restriction endonuclease subunit S n=1 Tax=Bacteroides acidifaciens TaxID=85831 RepID=UPI00188366B1|nr:restriction endonuclease subunit S [Bacteroides acidifaciens]MBF0833737.1 restriction endonuclease subunit S [Bacteroides acidifaciens]MCR1999263.1 restriction endonuclease subunit S [Bacteroides acidifaciens]